MKQEMWLLDNNEFKNGASVLKTNPKLMRWNIDHQFNADKYGNTIHSQFLQAVSEIRPKIVTSASVKINSGGGNSNGSTLIITRIDKNYVRAKLDKYSFNVYSPNKIEMWLLDNNEFKNGASVLKSNLKLMKWNIDDQFNADKSGNTTHSQFLQAVSEIGPKIVTSASVKINSGGGNSNGSTLIITRIDKNHVRAKLDKYNFKIYSVYGIPKCPFGFPHSVSYESRFYKPGICYTKEIYARQSQGPNKSWCAWFPEKDANVQNWIKQGNYSCKDTQLYKPIGCYNDRASRAVPNYIAKMGTTTDFNHAALLCAKKAKEKDYKYFSLQYPPGGTSCFGTDNLVQAKKYGSTNCGYGGGAWKNYLYALTPKQSKSIKIKPVEVDYGDINFENKKLQDDIDNDLKKISSEQIINNIENFEEVKPFYKTIFGMNTIFKFVILILILKYTKIFDIMSFF